MAGRPVAPASAIRQQTMKEAFQEAFATPSFWLLTFGFYVCGFHVAFYSVHLPAFICGLLSRELMKALLPSLGLWTVPVSFLAIGL